MKRLEVYSELGKAEIVPAGRLQSRATVGVTGKLDARFTRAHLSDSAAPIEAACYRTAAAALGDT